MFPSSCLPGIYCAHFLIHLNCMISLPFDLVHKLRSSNFLGKNIFLIPPCDVLRVGTFLAICDGVEHRPLAPSQRFSPLRARPTTESPRGGGGCLCLERPLSASPLLFPPSRASARPLALQSTFSVAAFANPQARQRQTHDRMGCRPSRVGFLSSMLPDHLRGMFICNSEFFSVENQSTEYFSRET